MLCYWWYDLHNFLVLNRFKLVIHLPTDLTESLEREDLGKYMSVAVFPLLVSVKEHLVQMLWRSPFLEFSLYLKLDTIVVASVFMLSFIPGCNKI